MTETRVYYGIPAQQAAFLDALRAACPIPIAALADWEPKADAVGLRLWLREERGDLVLDWEQMSQPEAGVPQGGAIAGGEVLVGEEG